MYLQYLDANNLYGWTMVQNLLIHSFKWENGEDFTPEKIDKLVKKDKRGYLLEVYVEYPKELHENHSGLSFLAEKMEIGREKKLVPNIKDKKGYAINIKALDQALRHGLKSKRYTGSLSFNKNQSEKDFFKLMNSSVFGKTMENIRNHKNIKLVTGDKKYLKYVINQT